MLLATDPPYGVELDMEWRDRAGHHSTTAPAAASYMREEGHRNTTISGDTRADWSEAYDLVSSLSIAYVWHSSRHASEVERGLNAVGFCVAQEIIWAKPIFIMSRQHYHWQHESAWYARKTGREWPWYGGCRQSTLWEAPSPKAPTHPKGGPEDAKVDLSLIHI